MCVKPISVIFSGASECVTLQSLTCVNVGVLLHVGLLVESLPAVLAGVWSRVRVNQKVRR